MSPYVDRVAQISQAQANAAGRAVQAASNCIAALLDASAEFAKSSANRNANFAMTILSAKSAEAVVDIHNAFAQDSVRAAAAMATKIADACSTAARQCSALAGNSLAAPPTASKD